VNDLPRLYFVRHGETAWSRSGQHTSRTNLPLTPHGEDEVRRLAPFLAGIDFARVFSSPLLRALQTCELASLAGRVEVEPGLTEWDYGDYEGRRSIDIRLERSGWDLWRDGCPNGESADAVTARADGLLGRLRALRGNIALFSHGQFGTALGLRWIGLPVTHGASFPLLSASLSILGEAPGHPGVAALSLWNFRPADDRKAG
jgi:probable phosphoglycerate mutase